MNDATSRPNGHKLELPATGVPSPVPDGAAAAPAAPLDNEALREQMNAQIDALLGPVLFCSARGALALVPRIPGQMVLVAVSRVLGKLLGELYVGDPIAVRAFRQECRRAFKKAIDETPIQELPPGHGVPMTAQPGALPKS